jgi:hypothetical protein
MKSCISCRVMMPLSSYYTHPRMADGHLNRCKACHKAASTANRHANIGRFRAYDRGRGSRQDADYLREHRQAHPERVAANSAVARAVRAGRMIKPCACWYCGSGPAVGHHADYSMPLAVSWLCQACHKQVHATTDSLNESRP